MGLKRIEKHPYKSHGLNANVTAIAVGEGVSSLKDMGHTCAIQNGVAKCWGWNNRYDQIGRWD